MTTKYSEMTIEQIENLLEIGGIPDQDVEVVLELCESKVKYLSLQTFYSYNIRDVLLVDRIDQKLKIIDQVITMAYLARANYEDMLGSVNPWTALAHFEMMAQKKVFPPRVSLEPRELLGGYVKDPKPGAYDWVVTFDLNSLYPMLVCQYNISPETMRGKLIDNPMSVEQVVDGSLQPYASVMKERNVTTAANLMTYDRSEQGFLPRILQKIYDQRVKFKDQAKSTDKKIQALKKSGVTDLVELEKQLAKFKNLDKGYKVFLNSAYGVLNNVYFILYNFDNAEAITHSGRLSIMWIAKEMNQYLNRVLKTENHEYVIGADTDSMFLNLQEIADRLKKAKPGISNEDICNQLDVICESKLAPFIDQTFKKLADYVNAREQKMKMKRESLCARAIFLGKKNYILNILNKEGVAFAEPKIDMKGIAAVKSSTPSSCRQKLKDAIKCIMQGDEAAVIKLISDFRREHMTLSFDEIAFPKTLNHMTKYYDKITLYKPRCPAHVRAALLWNRSLNDFGLKNLPTLQDGDKPKFVYLKTPNPIRENLISSPGPLPPEMKIMQYIDRNTMFEKGFIEPLKRIMDAIGWQMKKSSSLEDRLFG